VERGGGKDSEAKTSGAESVQPSEKHKWERRRTYGWVEKVPGGGGGKTNTWTRKGAWGSRVRKQTNLRCFTEDISIEDCKDPERHVGRPGPGY